MNAPIDTDYLYQALGVDALIAQLQQDEHRWAHSLPTDVKTLLGQLKHGDLPRWIKLIKSLPTALELDIDLTKNTVSLQITPPLNSTEQARVRHVLEGLKPWRKGPYNLFGIDIDSEWRSDLKWDRISEHLDLHNKTVLDVGCANGFFGWRMLGAGAKSVIGIDPGWLYIVQFLLFNSYAQATLKPAFHALLPYRLEDLPPNLAYFDTVLSMGVLYHRRSVFDHLFELKSCLKPGGQLLLETLVIPRQYGEVLVPKDRYARMRNVWFLPNTEILMAWLARVGFTNITLIDESDTTLEEQRKTPWLDSQSLEDCLDSKNSSLTVEGYPAPRRAVMMAYRPE
jgi:tRNA (mo5U34)-methyltransferase